jgi:ATP-binding cassette, subfamily F, member 3
LESDVERWTARLAEIDAALADPMLYRRDPARSEQLAKERASTARALTEAEEQWLAASGDYESAMAE